MNKSELIQSMAEKSGFSNKEVGTVLEAFIDIVEETLAAKDKITLIGFGTFQIVERAARLGRNPQTGKEIKIPATTKAKFKAGKSLDEAVSSGKTNTNNKTETKATTNKKDKQTDKVEAPKAKQTNKVEAPKAKNSDSKSDKSKTSKNNKSAKSKK